MRERRRRSPYRFQRIPLGRAWCEGIRLEDGRALLIRPIEPSDAERLQRSFLELTAEEIRFRFFHPIRELTPDYARALSTLDPAQAFALVIIEALPPERARIGGVARAAIEPDGISAEFALIVGQEIGGFGLGRYLLNRIIEWCRKKRLHEVYGRIMIENDRMLDLTRRMGFQCSLEPDVPGAVRVSLDLTSAAPRG